MNTKVLSIKELVEFRDSWLDLQMDAEELAKTESHEFLDASIRDSKNNALFYQAEIDRRSKK